jgi:hypothetical protein
MQITIKRGVKRSQATSRRKRAAHVPGDGERAEDGQMEKEDGQMEKIEL